MNDASKEIYDRVSADRHKKALQRIAGEYNSGCEDQDFYNHEYYEPESSDDTFNRGIIVGRHLAAKYALEALEE